MLGRDIGQSFQTIDFREKIAEAADRLFVPAARLDAALPAVPEHALHLREQVLIDVICGHGILLSSGRQTQLTRLQTQAVSARFPRMVRRIPTLLIRCTVFFSRTAGFYACRSSESGRLWYLSLL